MDVLIVGAGVGGLALENGLVKAGHRVRVLERAAGPRDEGAAVTLFSNGTAAAAGLGAPLDGLRGRIDELEIRDADDRRFGLTDLRPHARAAGPRGRRVRRVSKLAATEITNKPPNAAGRLAGSMLTPGLAGRAHLALIRRFSSVLHNEQV